MFQYILLLLFTIHYVESQLVPHCRRTDIANTYMDVAIAFIYAAKANTLPCSPAERNLTHGPVDCADILRQGQRRSGVYTIWPMNRLAESRPLSVYCDMVTDGGGWTVIQRRGNYGKPEDYFYQEWKSYKEGFGDITEDFWLGNDNIFALTNQKLYSARFDLVDVGNDSSFALYDYFWIDDEINQYTLRVGNFSGPAGDSMRVHNNQKFTTRDVDNDNNGFENCAISFRGAWWYNQCRYSNLNGLYLRGQTTRTSVNWWTFREDQNLESSEIKIRPKRA